MKKIILFLLLLAPLFVSAQEEKLKVYVFTSPTCGACHRLQRDFMPGFRARVENIVDLIEVDVKKDSLLFMAFAENYGDEYYYTPAMAVGETYLTGYPGSVGTGALKAINRALENGETTFLPESLQTHGEMFSTFTLAAVVINGLVDGVNPCAFAVIIFFVSFLAVYGYNRREVIFIGASYCAAVFLAYLLLGLGVFNFLRALSGVQVVIHIFIWLTIAACLVFFALSVYDLIVYAKTKKSDAMLLQMPKSFKKSINKVTGFFLRKKDGEKGRSMPALIGGAFAVGVLVSFIEGVCTGQVYLPTIVAILKENPSHTRAFLYLMLYNVFFIFPLLAVFALTLLGRTSEGFNKFFKKHLVLAKALLAIVFLGLAILLLKDYF